MQKIAFLADETHEAQRALDALSKRYGSVSAAKADVIVALGGDGFMLSTLHNTHSKQGLNESVRPNVYFNICWHKLGANSPTF